MVQPCGETREHHDEIVDVQGKIAVVSRFERNPGIEWSVYQPEQKAGGFSFPGKNSVHHPGDSRSHSDSRVTPVNRQCYD